MNCSSNMYSFNLLFSVLFHIVALIINNISCLSFCYVFQNFLRKRFPSQANKSLPYWQIMCHSWKIRQNKWLFKKPVCYKFSFCLTFDNSWTLQYNKLTSLLHVCHGCHRSGNVQGKTFFKLTAVATMYIQSLRDSILYFITGFNIHVNISYVNDFS